MWQCEHDCPFGPQHLHVAGHPLVLNVGVLKVGALLHSSIIQLFGLARTCAFGASSHFLLRALIELKKLVLEQVLFLTISDVC